jgi:fused signal recognition particle receptor
MVETAALVAVLLVVVGGLAAVWWRRPRRAPAALAGAPRATIRGALAATGQRLRAQLEAALGGGRDDLVFDRLEEALIGADVGSRTAGVILERVRARLGAGRAPDEVRRALHDEVRAVLGSEGAVAVRGRPWVVLVTGVNGVGKTTTIGKLATLHAAAGRKVMMVAADTFRAAAIEQLGVWAERTGADLVRHAPGADPSAVVFDGMRAAVARGADVVLVDTAGRLHTRTPLMDELRKLRRTIEREVAGAPQETLLVLDATTGQNALSQARTFTDAAGVTGVVVTKLDGTARGGVVVALRQELGIPVRYVGVGEGAEDLREFEPDEFVAGLLGDAAGR